MSILASFQTGISGLAAMGTAMGIVGDNIANSGTTGYKASRGEFQDVVASNLKGILGGNQIGRGVKLSGVTSIFSQGALTPTERDSDMAVRGDGFFVLKSKFSDAGISYTRDGSFRFDEKGRLSTADGSLVQGYGIDAVTGKVDSKLTDVQFSSNTIPAEGTKEIKIETNLDVRTKVNPKSFDILTADKDADLSTALRIYDTAGTSHSVNIHFYKTSESEWSWYATADGSELQGGTDGVRQQIAGGKLGFTDDGKLNTDQLDMSALNFRGAKADQKVDFNFGKSIITRGGDGSGSTQYGSKSAIYRQQQDGYAAGTLTNFSVDNSGTVSGAYSNGLTRPLASIAIARFENNEGLFKLGSNRFKEAILSGQAVVGQAGEAGRGQLEYKTLERSNVDIATEFVAMIQTQRNFQANAKTITTSDEMLQDVINLKR